MATSTRRSTRRNRAKPAHTGRQRHAHAHSVQQVRSSATKKRKSTRRWSHQVMERSDALDLENGIFKSGSPREIAESLKKSALASRRRKGSPFQSAMSMLNFYANRAGRNLSQPRKSALQKAKQELRRVFGREP